MKTYVVEALYKPLFGPPDKVDRLVVGWVTAEDMVTAYDLVKEKGNRPRAYFLRPLELADWSLLQDTKFNIIMIGELLQELPEDHLVQA
jgi:hypothetical protein